MVGYSYIQYMETKKAEQAAISKKFERLCSALDVLSEHEVATFCKESIPSLIESGEAINPEGLLDLMIEDIGVASPTLGSRMGDMFRGATKTGMNYASDWANRGVAAAKRGIDSAGNWANRGMDAASAMKGKVNAYADPYAANPELGMAQKILDKGTPVIKQKVIDAINSAIEPIQVSAMQKAGGTGPNDKLVGRMSYLVADELKKLLQKSVQNYQSPRANMGASTGFTDKLAAHQKTTATPPARPTPTQPPQPPASDFGSDYD